MIHNTICVILHAEIVYANMGDHILSSIHIPQISYLGGCIKLEDFTSKSCCNIT